MASNVLVKPNARGLLLLAGTADSLAARRDDEVINDFRVRTVQKRNHSDFCFTVCHAPSIIFCAVLLKNLWNFDHLIFRIVREGYLHDQCFAFIDRQRRIVAIFLEKK